MTDLPYEIKEERHVGIEVDIGNGPVRPIYRLIQIRIPDGEVTAAEWDALTFEGKRQLLVTGNLDSDE